MTNEEIEALSDTELASRIRGDAEIGVQHVRLLKEAADRLEAKAYVEEAVDGPETEEFLDAVKSEAAFQRGKWGREHDVQKDHADWYWLIGWLAGKAVRPEASRDKILHRIVATAAACLNWHAMTKAEEADYE